MPGEAVIIWLAAVRYFTADFQPYTLLRTALCRAAVRWLLASSCCLGTTLGAQAQLAPVATAPRGYDFLTVTTLETNVKQLSKLLYSPAFAGKTVVQLESLNSFSNAQNLEDIRRNADSINQALSELTIAGWELTEVHTIPFGSDLHVATTRYLFRKPRP